MPSKSRAWSNLARSVDNSKVGNMNKNGILINLSESENTRFGKEDFALQSLPQKVFSAIWAVESEVNNGGFAQYFSNDSAESASFVEQAL